MRIKSTIGAIGIIMLTVASDVVWADGNRYNMDRFYHSEISAAQAYQELERDNREHSRDRHAGKPVLIDVRTMEEYAAGHPVGGYNVPYPKVCTGCSDQTDATFYWEVYNIVNGDTDRLIMTLCRTGSRSVTGGNILARPQDYGINGPAFTNVRNIWEGFVGQYKYAYDGGTIMLDSNGQPVPLDLNNNGVMDADAADVYAERKDYNPDKDGWRNFQQLSWTTRIQRRFSYQQNPWQYYNLSLTPLN